VYIGVGAGVEKIAMIAGIAIDRRDLKDKDLNGNWRKGKRQEKPEKALKMRESRNSPPRVRQRATQ
jgi:hypothetical protein